MKAVRASFLNMDNTKKIAQLIIARLEGKDIKKRFKYYESLVKKGIGGFIVFGGELKEVRKGIKGLQRKAEIPLFIASDLEQGLGQQIEGGTIFPHAMAIGQAVNPGNSKDVKLLRKSINIIASEAKSAGINVIFSPVLDVNTNPDNPIICTRAFSTKPAKAALFGKEFIKGFQRHGLIACAKHFPGHGDTSKDSHRELPVIRAGMKRLNRVELYPFAKAIEAGVKMIMVGHLKVPAIDKHFPSSLSKKTITKLLREKMKFKGLVITDAMNMKAVSQYSRSDSIRTGIPGGKKLEPIACLKALKAGTDILLHPEDPESVIKYISSKYQHTMAEVEGSFQRVLKAKRKLGRLNYSGEDTRLAGKRSHWKTAGELTCKSIKIRNRVKSFTESPSVLIIDEDDNRSGVVFAGEIKSCYPEVRVKYIDNKYRGNTASVINAFSGKPLIVAVFSRVSAWKGRSGLSMKLKTLLDRATKVSGYSVIAGFCCPYILCELKADVVIEAYSGSEQAQQAVAGILCDP